MEKFYFVLIKINFWKLSNIFHYGVYIIIFTRLRVSCYCNRFCNNKKEMLLKTLLIF